MKLDKNYSIEKDAYNWILRYESIGGINKKTGKPIVTKNETYHGALKFALFAYLDSVLNPSSDIKELLSAINEAETRIINFVDKRANIKTL
ncbi:MAG: hypothetical protein WC389_15855 [Lutibacter sp.]